MQKVLNVVQVLCSLVGCVARTWTVSKTYLGTLVNPWPYYCIALAIKSKLRGGQRSVAYMM